VSLLVKPNQVETVTLAKELGTMSLTLRRPGDETGDSSDGASVQSLLSSDGESANEKKNPHGDPEESGISKWLSQAQAVPQPVQQIPQIETPVEVPAPPAPVVIPEEPPKFVMKIRTPNGDREYRWKDLNGEPVEAGNEPPVNQFPPAASPAVTVPTATVPAAQSVAPRPELRAMPIREFAPRGKASLHSGPVTPAPSQEPESTDSGLNENQDN
jgi:hypothetical protein